MSAERGLVSNEWKTRGTRGRRNDYANRAFCLMTRAKIALHAAAPRTDERKVQRAADDGTGDGNQPADPFFGGFFAEFDGEAFGYPRRKLFDHLFLGEVLAEINSGGSGGGEPKFAALVIALRFESVKQGQTLDQSQRDDGQQSGVWNQRYHAAEAEARALGESEPLRILDQVPGDVVQALDWNQVHAAEIGNVEAMLARQIIAKVFGIDFNRAQPLKETEAKKPADWRAGSDMV
jgi:hypothetical protein